MSYETPSKTIFQNRKRFHGTQKSPSESTSNWFKRLQNSIKSCQFNRISEYMLIDKFVSGLSETDFETISQVPTWTIDELILVVINSPHIFDSKQITDNNECDQQQSGTPPPYDTSFIKAEQAMSETENEGESNDALMQESTTDVDAKRPLTATERKRNYIKRLKETGKFEEYKRKKADHSARARLRAKNSEHLLSPELQIHLTNQRRQANREKMRRYRQRTSTKTERSDVNAVPDAVWLEPNHESTLDTGKYLEIKSELKRESVCPLESDFAADRLQMGLECGDVLKPETKPKRKFTSTVPVRRSNVSSECYLCALKCEGLLALQTHLKVCHPVEDLSILKCYLCDKTTKSREVLTRHLREFHCKVLMHKCSCCTEEFQRRGDLNQHLKQIHPDYKPFVCEVCGYSSRTKSDLWSHTRTHTGRKDSKCNICGLLLATSSVLSKHMNIHTGVKKHCCEHCGTHFRQRRTLLNHLICVHKQGEKPIVCDICGKRFVSMYHLKLHSNSHTGDRPYKCKYCGSCFTQPASMKLHERRIHEANVATK